MNPTFIKNNLSAKIKTKKRIKKKRKGGVNPVRNHKYKSKMGNFSKNMENLQNNHTKNSKISNGVKIYFIGAGPGDPCNG